MNIAERVAVKFANLTDEQKDDAVNKVMTNLKAKNDSDSEVEEGEPEVDFKDIEFTESEDAVDEESVESVDDVNEESVEEESTAEGGLGLMDELQALADEIEVIKEDGKVDSFEVVGLFQNMMDMVTELLRAKPGRKPRKKASVEDRVTCVYLQAARQASRGFQVNRKDKDQMSDTGGASKGRDREPGQKPPRDDMKNRYRTRRKTKSEKDTDVDNDKDLKSSSVHPLDRNMVADNWELSIPEENYYRKVWSSLVNIIASNNGVSEKNFKDYNQVMQGVDGMLRDANVMKLVDSYEVQGKRPGFCAEDLYFKQGD